MLEHSIIDAHVNLASIRFIPKRFIEDTASNMHHRVSAMGQNVPKERIASMMLAQYQDHRAEMLVTEMSNCGITRAALLAPDFSFVAECEIPYEDVIKKHYEISQQYPDKFILFAGADPRSGQQGIDLFHKAVHEYGFAGLKLYPPAGYSPSDKSLYPYYEICAAEGLPVISHTGPGWHSLDFSLGHPMHIDKASRDFPVVNFILGHGGVSYVDDSSYLCMYRENVYMDISGFAAVNSADGWQAHLNRLFKTGVNHKIVFGTSWPASRMSISLKQMISEFRSDGTVFNGIPINQQKMILNENIKRLLQRSQLIEEKLCTK